MELKQTHIVHDDIKGRDPICSYEQQRAAVDFVDIANLAAGDEGKIALALGFQQRFSHDERRIVESVMRIVIEPYDVEDSKTSMTDYIYMAGSSSSRTLSLFLVGGRRLTQPVASSAKLQPVVEERTSQNAQGIWRDELATEA